MILHSPLASLFYIRRMIIYFENERKFRVCLTFSSPDFLFIEEGPETQSLGDCVLAWPGTSFTTMAGKD